MMRFRHMAGRGQAWVNLDKLKADLAAQVGRSFAEGTVKTVHDSSNEVLIPGAVVYVPYGFPDPPSRGYPVVAFQLPTSFDIVVEELTRALLSGAFPGLCEFCPKG